MSTLAQESIDYAALKHGCATASLWANALSSADVERPDLSSEECCALADLLDDDGPGSVWSQSAREVVEDVEDWAMANAVDVLAYMRTTERDEQHVGHDFALSRAGHGTGLWDRGAGAVGERLHEATKPYGPGDLFVDLDEHGYVTRIDA